MTQNQNTEPVDAPSEDGSAVIKALRAQIRDLEKDLKAAPDAESIIAEYEAGRQRTGAVEAALVSQGVPKGIAPLVQDKLGESEVTDESVAKILADLGFQAEEDQGASGQGERGTSREEALPGVTELGTQVRAAAQGGSAASIMQQINAATSRGEVAKIAEEAGFLTTQY